MTPWKRKNNLCHDAPSLYIIIKRPKHTKYVTLASFLFTYLFLQAALPGKRRNREKAELGLHCNFC